LDAWNNLGSKPKAIPVFLLFEYSVLPPSKEFQNSSGSSDSLISSFTAAEEKKFTNIFLPNSFSA